MTIKTCFIKCKKHHQKVAATTKQSEQKIYINGNMVKNSDTFLATQKSIFHKNNKYTTYKISKPVPQN